MERRIDGEKLIECCYLGAIAFGKDVSFPTGVGLRGGSDSASAAAKQIAPPLQGVSATVPVSFLRFKLCARFSLYLQTDKIQMFC
jgi:hypothetical protein